MGKLPVAKRSGKAHMCRHSSVVAGILHRGWACIPTNEITLFLRVEIALPRDFHLDLLAPRIT